MVERTNTGQKEDLRQEASKRLNYVIRALASEAGFSEKQAEVLMVYDETLKLLSCKQFSKKAETCGTCGATGMERIVPQPMAQSSQQEPYMFSTFYEVCSFGLQSSGHDSKMQTELD